MNELYGADAANPLGGTAMTARTALTEVHSRAFDNKANAQAYVAAISSGDDFSTPSWMNAHGNLPENVFANMT